MWGTGSTANYFIDLLAAHKHQIEGAVASSEASAERLRANGIAVMELNGVGDLAVYVDGADEATHHRHLIKGGGRRAHTGKNRRRGKSTVYLRRRRLENSSPPRKVSVARRGDPDGTQLRCTGDGQNGRPT